MTLLNDYDPIIGTPQVDEEITRAIQEFPALARRVAELQSAQAAAQLAVTAFEQSRLVNAPVDVRASLAELTRTTVEASSALSEYRQRIREGVAEAKKQGTLTAPDLAKLTDAGLAGMRSRYVPVALNASSAASRVNHVPSGMEGLGFLPSVLRHSPAAIAHAAARAYGFQSANVTRGGGRGVRGLGVVPIVLIGYGLAVAIGAALVGGSLVAAYRLTSESVARAEAVRDQNAAALDAWRAQVAAQTPTGGSLPPLGSPTPLPPLPELPGSGGVLATVARSTVPVVLLAALAVGGFLLFRRSRNGKA